MPRLEVAVISRDGDAQLVNAARPASLVAFTDAHDGKVMPETVREIAFVVHHAMGVKQPLDDWLDTLESISADTDDVRLARRIIAGDETARRIVLGDLTEDEAEQYAADLAAKVEAAAGNGAAPDPTTAETTGVT